MRRLLIAIAFACLGISSAFAKPKVAVTMDGDSDDKMGEAVRELLDGKLAVVTPKDVERAVSKLGLSGELEEGDVQRLRQKLDAAVVVHGKLARAGGKKTVRLTVWVRGKKPSDFNVQYKTAGSEKFRETVRDALLKRIGSIDELEGDEEKPKKKRLSDGDDDKDGDKDGDKPKKKSEDGDKDDDKDGDKPKKKRLADADGDKNGDKNGDKDSDKDKKADAGDDEKPKKKKKKVAAADDDDEGKPRARKRKRGDDGDGDGDGDGEGVREASARPLPAARVDAGLGYAARYLTYTVDAASTNRPPKVLTPAPSLRIEGEVYPLAFMKRESPLAGIAIFGEYDKTLGLSIAIPGAMNKSAPINQSHYAIGAGYRLALGKVAVSAGLAYARRRYVADRASLTAPTDLDTPDVDYAAISPMLGGRAQVVPKIAVFAGLDAMLITAAGAIAETANYGAGDVFGIGGHAGVDVALGKQIGLRFAAEYNQVSLDFKGTGTMAAARKVSAASDRNFGMSATFAAMY